MATFSLGVPMTPLLGGRRDARSVGRRQLPLPSTCSSPAGVFGVSLRRVAGPGRASAGRGDAGAGAERGADARGLAADRRRRTHPGAAGPLGEVPGRAAPGPGAPHPGRRRRLRDRRQARDAAPAGPARHARRHGQAGRRGARPARASRARRDAAGGGARAASRAGGHLPAGRGLRHHGHEGARAAPGPRRPGQGRPLSDARPPVGSRAIRRRALGRLLSRLQSLASPP